jgi:hypothetical protein
VTQSQQARAPRAQEKADTDASQAGAPQVEEDAPSADEDLGNEGTSADQIDVCGYGRVARSALNHIMSEAQAAADAALARLAARLTDGKKERDIALGLFLRLATIQQEVTDEHPGCDDASCRQDIDDIVRMRRASYEEALQKMALTTRDPQVYAGAFHSCRYAGNSCMPAERWAELEPDNGVPWMFVGGLAGLQRAAKAKRFDARYPDLRGLLQSPEFRNEAPQTRFAIAGDLIAMEMTSPTLNYAMFVSFCAPSPGADLMQLPRASKGVCGDLANLLLKHDRALLGFATGITLAKSAGWPPAVVNSLLEEKGALLRAMQHLAWTDETGGDCAKLAEFEGWLADYSRLGEVGLARKLVAEAAKTAAQSAPESDNRGVATK